MFKNEVIDRYMLCIMQNLKKTNAQVSILYSLADLNVELTLLEDKLGRFLMFAFLKLSFL